MLFLLFFSVDSVHEFLCFHNIPVLVWNALNDSESYVRASAIHLIGSLACQSKLWTYLLQNSKVSEVFLKTFYFHRCLLLSAFGRFFYLWAYSLVTCNLDLSAFCL